MAPSLPHSARKLSHKSSFFLALLCLVGTACSTTDQNTKILFEDPRGTVSLQTMSDQSIQATHPINLEPNLLAKILRGVEIQDQEHGFQKFLAGRSAPVPVFSDDQIRFLAPLLAEGLRTATPDQRIEYRAQTTHEGSMFESSTTETTAGSLYAYGRSLYVTLSQYRYAPNQANLNSLDYRSRPPDYSGLQNRTLLFTPSDAQRSDSFDPPEGGKPTDRFLAIDYQMLQHAPAAASTEKTAPQMERVTSPMRESPAGTGASEAPAPSTEALAKEVETLRKELQSVQKQLGNQTTGADSPKQKTTPQQKWRLKPEAEG